MLIITLIPAGYLAYFNVMYPLLPALYTGEDVVKAFSGVLEGEETGFNEDTIRENKLAQPRLYRRRR